MKDLLIHTSKVKAEILRPHATPGDVPCICFSLNKLVSYFGEYIYLFDREILEKEFRVVKVPTGGVDLYHRTNFEGEYIEYRFHGEPLGEEFRIYQPIDVQRFGLAVPTHFNHMRGTLETRFTDFIINQYKAGEGRVKPGKVVIDFSK